MFDFNGAKGFIFDCDGTLLDTLGAWEEAERELFAQAGPLTVEQEDQLHAAPIEEAARLFHELYGVGESARTVLDHLDAHLLPYYANEARLFPGVSAFVHAVNDHGIPAVVLSSSPRRYLEAGLSRAGLLDCFVELVTTDETGCSKQETPIYDRACALLGAARGDIWAVDDAPYAIKVMGDYGFRTIAPLNGCSAARRALLQQRATLVVDTLGDLL